MFMLKCVDIPSANDQDERTYDIQSPELAQFFNDTFGDGKGKVLRNQWIGSYWVTSPAGLSVRPRVGSIFHILYRSLQVCLLENLGPRFAGGTRQIVP